jgi:hypothetical protein
MSILRIAVWVAAAVLIFRLGAPDAQAQLAVANCLEESPHVGVAMGVDANDANSKAQAACVKNGGNNACCSVYATIIRGASGQKTICLSGAQGFNGDFGYGTGIDKQTAAAAAISSCKIGAVAGKFCKQVGDIVCQTTK